MLNVQHQESLHKLREELLFRVYLPEDTENPPAPKYLNKASLEDRAGEKKVYERKIQDLTKKAKQLGIELETYRRKYEVVFQKYESIKKLSTKDKFIGRTREEEEAKIITFKEKRIEKTHNSSYQNLLQLNTHNLEEVNSLMQNNSVLHNDDNRERRNLEDTNIDTTNILDESTFT